MRALDWAATPLGLPEAWPPALKTLVGLMLGSHQPMLIVWGEAHTTLYNDGYAAMCGTRHPRALGRSFEELWHDIWDQVQPILARAYAGEAVHMDDIAFVMHRNGFPEETHFSFGYTPVRDETGAVTGMFCACAETTAAVKAGRQTRAERERLTHLFALSPNFVAVLTGPDHVVEFANPAYRRLVADRDILGRPVREALPEVEGQGFFERLDAVFRTGEGFTAHAAPVVLLREPGAAPEPRFLDFAYQPMRDAAGSVTGVFVEGSDVTERVRGTAALAESETRFRAMADDAPVMMWVTDAEGACLYLNRRWYEFTGQTEAEALGLGWLDAVHPDDRGWSGETFLAANARREGFRLEYRLRHVDGRHRWAIDTASPRFSADGDFLGYIGSVVDIDERRAAELALAQSEERQRLAVENAEVGLWDVDPVAGTLYWPARVKAMFGIAPDRPVSMDDYYAGLHPEDREQASAAYAAAADPERRALYDVEYRTIGREDGVVRWVAAKGRGVFDDAPGGSGRCLRVVGTAIDITARKAIEEQLVETTRRLDAVLGNATQAVFMMDERQHCAYMNRAAERLTGYTLEETQGKTLHDVVHHTRPDGTPYPLHECPIDQAFPENNQEQGQEIFVHKDGTFYPVAFTASPIRDADGRPVGTVIEARNIEAELRAKAQLEAFNAGLEQQVAERTAELMRTEEALRQSQKMEAVGQLTGGLAHDFNNLLTGISGSLELLQTRLAQGRLTEIDRYVNAAQGASKRAAALTHRLLAFSRRQTLDPKPTDVNRLVAGMEELIRRTIGPGITLEVVAAGGLWSALIDPSQLENALLNLCINARDAMPEGGRITIETGNKWLDGHGARARDLEPGQYLSLCVTDTGTGMSPEVQAKAFDPFFTTKPIGQGTGLGLSMIYGFVRQSGGQVRIYSEVGQGTTMCLYLPRHYGAADAVEPHPDLASAPRAEQGETVLIVDDEPTVRMLVTEVLEDLGYTAIEAADGPAGLKVLQSDVRIDLLVTDVGLPGGMNGRQMADAGRERRPDLKVLFITGYAENAVVGNGHLEPGMAVITKPFVMETLAARIKEMIDGW
ncbi:PAS domain S-box protein [Methylobacterium sp. Leaf118]|uniref:PAS domain S-box protein n=1 Tax=Methylobacterium sp. Leaf118 TaxID=2876562 RepID=UPI003FA60F53